MWYVTRAFGGVNSSTFTHANSAHYDDTDRKQLLPLSSSCHRLGTASYLHLRRSSTPRHFTQFTLHMITVVVKRVVETSSQVEDKRGDEKETEGERVERLTLHTATQRERAHLTTQTACWRRLRRVCPRCVWTTPTSTKAAHPTRKARWCVHCAPHNLAPLGVAAQPTGEREERGSSRERGRRGE